MKKILILLLLTNTLSVFAKEETFLPSCTSQGKIYCPEGFEPECPINENSKPQCIYVDKQYVAGCYKFERKEKININLPTIPNGKIQADNNANVYVLNKENIKCKKI